MPQTLRIGSKGPQVKLLQKHLKLPQDGSFGPQTQQAILDLQEKSNIYADGIVGTNTWRALVDFIPKPKVNLITRIDLDKWGAGYSNASLAESTANKVASMREELNWLGGAITSSGGTRSLHAEVGKNRSATSFHYSGRALDLFVYSGMNSLKDDPYLVQRDGDHWIVWARVKRGGEERTIPAYKYDLSITPTTALVVNLTEMFEDHGMKRIRARPSFWKGGNNGAAEWWHFQDEENLVRGETFFGELLTAAHSVSKVRGTPPWEYRHYLFGIDFH